MCDDLLFLMRGYFICSNMLRCVEVLSSCYGQSLDTHLSTITKVWAQDAISCVVSVWVFILHGCFMQPTRCTKMVVSGVVTGWSLYFISAFICLLVREQMSKP